MSKKELYVLGDSISMGYGQFLEKMCETSMNYSRKSGEEEALKNLDIPVGANGGDSSRVLEYLNLLKKSGQFKKDIMLINCGLHDLKADKESGEKQVPLDLYRQNLEQLANVAKELADCVVWINTTPVLFAVHHERKPFDRSEKDVIEYNKCADEIMAKANIRIADLWSFTMSYQLDETILADGVHFCPEIQEKQAAFLAGYLNAI